jgi:flavin reductase (DIM6/NTAB) family NADH-FMN oxidoreductase RutF
MKTITPSEISELPLQMLMQTAVAPRPIALASTIDKNGNPNLSPFSFYNMFSVNPPILIFSPLLKPNTSKKDTLENILEIPEVVIGTVNFEMVQQISLSSADFEKGVNEFVKSGLTMKDAEIVKPKLIEESAVNFECKVLEVKTLGKNSGAGNLIICEVVKIHVHEKYLNEHGNLDQNKLNLVSRLGGIWFGRNNEQNLFEVPRPVKAIGIDQLPEEIKHSKIFTGNDLAMLANIEILPEGNFSTNENVHLQAKKLLRENKIDDAWGCLSV